MANVSKEILDRQPAAIVGGTIKNYYKKKLVNKNIEVEYSSEENEIYVRIEHLLNNGASIGSSYLKMHPSYVEPLVELLREVVKK